MNYALWKFLSSDVALGLLVLAIVLGVAATYATVVALRRKGSWIVYLAGAVLALYVGGLAWWHFMTLVDCGRPVPRLDAGLRQLQNDLNVRAGDHGGKVELCENRLVLHVRVHNQSDAQRQDALLNEVRQRRSGSLKATVVTYYDAVGRETREEHF